MPVATPPSPLPGARLLFSLDPAVLHLNHGSFGAVPIGVQRAQQRLRDEMEANPLRFFARGLSDRIAHTRRHLAAFLGADPDGSALVGNTTTGVAIVLQSLRLRPGDEIADDRARVRGGALAVAGSAAHRRTHRVVALPLAPRRRRGRRRRPRSGHAGRTKLVIVDQVTSADRPGASRCRDRRRAARHRHPAAGRRRARARACCRSTSPAIGADFWVGNLHKWAYAPRGTALFAVRRAWRRRIEPLVVSWEQDAGFPGRWSGRAPWTTRRGWPRRSGCSPCVPSGSTRSARTTPRSPPTASAVVGEALGSPPICPTRRPPGLAMRIVPLPAGLATTMPRRGDRAAQHGSPTKLACRGQRSTPGRPRLPAAVARRSTTSPTSTTGWPSACRPC